MNLLTELFLARESYIGAIENLSEYGLYLRILASKNAIDFTSGTPLELEFRCLSGEELNLHCEVRRVYTNIKPTNGTITSMGMEIIDPPQKYKELIRNL